jgi:hypothetical protein
MVIKAEGAVRTGGPGGRFPLPAGQVLRQPGRLGGRGLHQGGKGALAVDGEALEVKAANALPSSD